MPFLRSSSRPQAVDCFFCLSPSLLPPHPGSSSSSVGDRKGKGRAIAPAGTRWNWRCERCGCWNTRDERGEMLSDLPAMHDPSMNERSFSLRARPSLSHLPPTQTTSIFCHHCLANQALIINILANYLPDDSDPTFPQLYADLPSHLRSLHARYPPVCANCQPGVDDALRRSNQKGQVQALGSALQRGAGSGAHDSEGRGEESVTWVDELFWRVRGTLFCLDMAGVWLVALLSLLHLDPMISRWSLRISDQRTKFPLLALRVLSLGWLAWDPYWLRKARSRGRARVSGRKIWVRNMVLVYILRLSYLSFWLFAADMPPWLSEPLLGQVAFALDIALVLHALTRLRISQPATIQLVEPVHLSTPHDEPVPSHPVTHAPTPQHLEPQTPIAAHSLNPIFGQPSLQLSQSQTARPAENEPMDWEPSPGTAVGNGGWTKRSPAEWDAFGVGKQRMFASSSAQDETGLESLLAGWGLGGNTAPTRRGERGAAGGAVGMGVGGGIGGGSGLEMGWSKRRKQLGASAAGMAGVVILAAIGVRLLEPGALDSIPRVVWRSPVALRA